MDKTEMKDLAKALGAMLAGGGLIALLRYIGFWRELGLRIMGLGG